MVSVTVLHLLHPSGGTCIGMSHVSGVAGAALVDVPHDSESSTGGSGSGKSLPEDAVLNPVKPSVSGEIPSPLLLVLDWATTSGLPVPASLVIC